MNARFDEEPKRKRLKQSSIKKSFRRHRSSLKSKDSVHFTDYKVNERGQMHDRNLRKLTSPSKCKNDDCKTNYSPCKIQALFRSVLKDVSIESEGSPECSNRVKRMNETYQQKCSSSTSESITEWSLAFASYLRQNIREIFVDKGVADVHNGLRGLSEEKLSQFHSNIRVAEQTNEVQRLVCEMCNILVLLCHENSGNQSTAQIERWGKTLAFLSILEFLKPFFKDLQDLRLHMRLENLSCHLRNIMEGVEDDFFVLDVCNIARSLMNFARFVPSKLVTFQLNASTNSPVACNGEIVQYDKTRDKYYQWFNITKESEEELQLHATAFVYGDGRRSKKVTEFHCTFSTVTMKAGSIGLRLGYVWGSEKVDIAEVSGGEYVEHRQVEQSARASPSTSLEDAVPRGRGLKKDLPSRKELETLSRSVGTSWESLARRLGFHEGDITGFDKDNQEYAKKTEKMLFEWKERKGSDATYKVLFEALCDPLCQRKGIAEDFCCISLV